MRISSFTSYFEILAVLNAGYAGFETFSIYTLRLLRGQISDMATITLLKERLLDYQREMDPASSAHAGVQDDIEMLSELQEQQMRFDTDLQKSDKKFAEISMRTTPSFVAGAVFCIAVLVVAGFEQFLPESELATGMALVFLDLTVVYMVANCILPNSWTVPAISSNNAVRIIVPGVFVLIFLFLGLANAYFWKVGFTANPTLEFATVIMALIIAVSPCLFNLPRVLGVLVKYHKKSKPIITDIQKKLEAWETLNRGIIDTDLSSHTTT